MISRILNTFGLGTSNAGSQVFRLNPDLEEGTPYRKETIEDLIQRIHSRMDVKPIGTVSTSLTPDMNIQQSLVYGLSEAYSFHQAISIAPHDLWYVIMTEIAREVNANPATYRTIFTSSDTKINIMVHSGPGVLPIESIINELTRLVPVDLNLFIPEFSTYNQMALAATMAAFADATKSYYNYMTFCCGIREIEFRGSIADWQLMVTHAVELQNVFRSTVLETFLVKVAGRAQTIVDVLSGGDPEVLQSIFSSTRIGSGGELRVDGWFASDFFVKGGGHKIENYPNTWSLVPFKDLPTGRKFTDVYGAFHNTIENGFRVQNYGRFTFELPKED